MGNTIFYNRMIGSHVYCVNRAVCCVCKKGKRNIDMIFYVHKSNIQHYLH